MALGCELNSVRSNRGENYKTARSPKTNKEKKLIVSLVFFSLGIENSIHEHMDMWAPVNICYLNSVKSFLSLGFFFIE